jgi:nitroreductase
VSRGPVALEEVRDDIEPLFAIMSTMRAMRRLSPRPVSRALLQRLVASATWAPSAGNAQAYSWLIVTDREVLRSLEPLWRRALDLYWQAAGPAPGPTMDEDAIERMRRASLYQRDHFLEIPALIIPCYDLAEQRRAWHRPVGPLISALASLGWKRAVSAMRNARRSYDAAEAASVYPGVQNLLLAARALGLGATLTTVHLAFEGEFKRALGIPKRVRTFAIIPVGWPLGRFGPVRRRSADEAIHWERW